MPAAPILTQAKDRMTRARAAARRADPLGGAMFDRWVSEALMAARDVAPEMGAAMYLRIAIMLEIAVDRQGWPHGRVRGLPSRPTL